jgi:hypothetical protein
MANPIDLWFDLHDVSFATSFALRMAGIRIASSRAIIAITTNSSMRVKPFIDCLLAGPFLKCFIGLSPVVLTELNKRFFQALLISHVLFNIKLLCF